MIFQRLKHRSVESRIVGWRDVGDLEGGYSVLLPSPMDMPFLLRLGLESLLRVDTSRCREILVIPDGWDRGSGETLKQVLEEFDDPRIDYVEFSPGEKELAESLRPTNRPRSVRRTLRSAYCRCTGKSHPPPSRGTHWLQIVRGLLRSSSEYVFLHDADAIPLERRGIERQFDEAVSRRMYTLGVTPRWDPFFRENGLRIPGTWELFMSARWARSRSPFDLLQGVVRGTPYGRHRFDTTLWAQTVDYRSGRVGVMEDPPEFVHFNGTIVTYRAFAARRHEVVVDELFRILLLALIEDAFSRGGARLLPTPGELAEGITNHAGPVSYRSEVCRRGYAEFRQLVGKMCAAPAFRGGRGERLLAGLRPFDEAFAADGREPVRAAVGFGEVRVAGLS